MNRAQIMGRLGKDPESHADKEGRKFVTFSVATTDYFKDKNGERQEDTQWHQVTCFSKNLCHLMEKYAPKGRQIFVEGKLRTSTYQKTGEKSPRYSTEIIASKIELLGDKVESAHELEEGMESTQEPQE
ncbi:MAG TPA: single-stranded DNA-binding protein [Alphaproteobacteria bacterium]|nr:single-stranded DNA-binding protein [Alphaproteobacteria bacterium]